MSFRMLPVKAIQFANLQGQKIVTITKDNYEETLPMLHLAPAAIATCEEARAAEPHIVNTGIGVGLLTVGAILGVGKFAKMGVGVWVSAISLFYGAFLEQMIKNILLIRCRH